MPKNLQKAAENKTDGMQHEAYDHDIQKKALAIMLSSETANIEMLRRFVEYIVNLQRTDINALRIHTWIKTKKKKDKAASGRWQLEESISNKTIQNTIVSRDVEKNVFEDIEKFMAAEKYYALKGMPYKRGYLLHGPPGTGKTSIIKAVANKYKLDIFTIPPQTLNSDSDLILLASMMAEQKKGRQYIVAFEDVDRCKLFKKGRQSDISSQTLLNFLDGLSEAYGRILFFTANKPTNITRKKAYVRPGRIDKIVNIDFVNTDQLCRMFIHFYDDLDEVEADERKRVEALMKAIDWRKNWRKNYYCDLEVGIPPAKVVEAMWQHQTNYKEAIQYLINELGDEDIKEKVNKVMNGEIEKDNDESERTQIWQKRKWRHSRHTATKGKNGRPLKPIMLRRRAGTIDYRIKRMKTKIKKEMRELRNAMIKRELLAVAKQKNMLLPDEMNRQTDTVKDALEKQRDLIQWQLLQHNYAEVLKKFDKEKEHIETLIAKRQKQHQARIEKWKVALEKWKAKQKEKAKTAKASIKKSKTAAKRASKTKRDYKNQENDIDANVEERLLSFDCYQKPLVRRASLSNLDTLITPYIDADYRYHDDML